MTSTPPAQPAPADSPARICSILALMLLGAATASAVLFIAGVGMGKPGDDAYNDGLAHLAGMAVALCGVTLCGAAIFAIASRASRAHAALIAENAALRAEHASDS